MARPGRKPSRTIRQQFYIRAPPEKVFRATSEPDRVVGRRKSMNSVWDSSIAI